MYIKSLFQKEKFENRATIIHRNKVPVLKKDRKKKIKTKNNTHEEKEKKGVDRRKGKSKINAKNVWHVFQRSLLSNEW